MKKVTRKINKVKVLKFILITLLIITFSIFGIIKLTNISSTEKNSLKTEEQTPSEDNIYKTNMIMVGDNLIHAAIYEEAKTNTNDNTYDFKPMYELIKPIVKNYDIAYYNQETILGGSEIGVSSYPAFNSPYEVGDAMIDAGFNLVSLATNHTLDKGKNAVINSRNYWNSKENVLAVGSYSSEEEQQTIEIKESNNITYTMLNYTYGTNGIPVPNGENYLVNIWPVTGNNPDNDSSYQNYKTQIKKDIEAVRNKVDVLIVAMHWGIEYETTPNSYQIDAAKYLSSLGVDIIIGTHPHVVQPIDYIDSTLVIYSLGNFLSSHEVVNISNRVGLMSSIEITKDSKTNKITISNLNNELLYTYYTNDYKNIKIIPFSKINSNYLSNYKEIYEEHKSIIQKLNNNINVVPLSS